MTGWQWHQLDHMQIIITLLQTNDHTSTSSLNLMDLLTDFDENVMLMHIAFHTLQGKKYSNYKNARWRSALILKNRKGAISLQQINQF